jgi:hypothetical protein
MPGFKDNDIGERREASARAKKAMLEQFRAGQTAGQPANAERRAERLAVIEAREARKEAKKAENERRAIEHEAGLQQAAQLAKAQEEAEAAEKQRIADEAVKRAGEQKATRDARYAARKARRR